MTQAVINKTVHRIFLFVIGIVFGAFLIVSFSRQEILRDSFEEITTLSIPAREYPIRGLFPIAAYVIITMVAVLIFVALIRLLGNSQRLKVMSFIANVVTALVASLPLCLLIFTLIEPYIPQLKVDADIQIAFLLLSILGFLYGDSTRSLLKRFLTAVLTYVIENVVLWIVRIGIAEGELAITSWVLVLVNSVMCFGIAFSILQSALEEAIYAKLKKPYKRFKLAICHVNSSTSFEEKEVVIHNQLFESCYSAMKLNSEKVFYADFFRISEMNFSGTKEKSAWNYYENGEIIKMSDEELCMAFVKK